MRIQMYLLFLLFSGKTYLAEGDLMQDAADFLIFSIFLHTWTSHTGLSELSVASVLSGSVYIKSEGYPDGYPNSLEQVMSSSYQAGHINTVVGMEPERIWK